MFVLIPVNSDTQVTSILTTRSNPLCMIHLCTVGGNVSRASVKY